MGGSQNFTFKPSKEDSAVGMGQRSNDVDTNSLVECAGGGNEGGRNIIER